MLLFLVEKTQFCSNFAFFMAEPHFPMESYYFLVAKTHFCGKNFDFFVDFIYEISGFGQF